MDAHYFHIANTEDEEEKKQQQQQWNEEEEAAAAREKKHNQSGREEKEEEESQMYILCALAFDSINRENGRAHELWKNKSDSNDTKIELNPFILLRNALKRHYS